MTSNRETSTTPGWLVQFEQLIFDHRRSVLLAFVVFSLWMLYQACQLKVSAGFEKNLPLQHPYMQTLVEYQSQFGGGNKILVALSVKQGEIFSAEYFKTFEALNRALSSLPGVDKTQISSIFTPNVRYLEAVEGGFDGGPVIPADFETTPAFFERVKANIQKAGILGRLVARDYSAAMISLQLLEKDPATGIKTDYLQVAQALEALRAQYQTDRIQISIIGFAKLVGDISDGARGVLLFLVLALLVSAINLYAYTASVRMTLLPVFCALLAVLWQLGWLAWLGFGIDPMLILLPFLIFAIGVSHGMQSLNGVAFEYAQGQDVVTAARRAFRRLLIPGTIAILSDTIGFLTLWVIDIGTVRELAIAASIGVSMKILSNMILLPVLLSYVGVGKRFATWQAWRQPIEQRLWQRLSVFTEPGAARWTLGLALLLAVVVTPWALQPQIGEQQPGSPALWPDARYNLDTQQITQRFSIGIDLLTVIVEGPADACTDPLWLQALDQFHGQMEQYPQVQSVVSLPMMIRLINAGYSEGFPKWRLLPSDPAILAQALALLPTSTGLLNKDCSRVPVYLFLKDHQAQTLSSIVMAVKTESAKLTTPQLKFRLASGSAGVMAATNEAVEAAHWPMLAWVYAAILLLCALSFRSWRACLCILLPLSLVSWLTQALMAWLDIGLTVSTLPVAALGAGIGVDYGIYLYSELALSLNKGLRLKQAYQKTLAVTGNAVIFTAVTLAVGVIFWLGSALKFQADMGLLLAFMFSMNMVAAIILLPALACCLQVKAKA